MLILKSKMNYQVHRMLNTRLSTFPLSDIGSTKSQEDIRAARGNIETGIAGSHHVVGDTGEFLCDGFSPVLILRTSALWQQFLRRCVHLPLSIAMVIPR